MVHIKSILLTDRELYHKPISAQQLEPSLGLLENRWRGFLDFPCVTLLVGPNPCVYGNCIINDS